MQWGGPYVGYMCCTEKLIRKMPGRIVGKTVDNRGQRTFVLTLQAREQHIRRQKATSNICSNQSLMALFVTMYCSLMGRQGLKEAAELSYAGAHYLCDQLLATGRFSLVYDQPFFNEFVVRYDDDVDALQRRLLAALQRRLFAALRLRLFAVLRRCRSRAAPAYNNSASAHDSSCACRRPFRRFAFLAYVRRQFHAVGRLVEGTVEGCDEEHHHLSSHTQEQHEVGTRQVGQLKQRTENHDGGAPAVGVVHERLSGDTIQPLLQAVDDIEFTVSCHID
jgi:hypothetical protein